MIFMVPLEHLVRLVHLVLLVHLVYLVLLVRLAQSAWRKAETGSSGSFSAERRAQRAKRREQSAESRAHGAWRMAQSGKRREHGAWRKAEVLRTSSQLMTHSCNRPRNSSRVMPACSRIARRVPLGTAFSPGMILTLFPWDHA